MTRRVLLHVGTPKTGTSYLQDVLFRNRERLTEHGVLYPADRFDAHFLAALDLMRLPWGGLETEALGRWDATAAQVREHGGTSILSHEILARASRAQAERALVSLGRDDSTDSDPVEIHLLISVRDLVRQVPAEWQENVKHRSTLSYAQFLEQIRDPARAGRIGSWFWSVQELPDILARWGDTLPPERVHVITVPPSGGSPTLLWERFSEAFGLDELDLDLDGDRSNPSLGVPETALLRRINETANALVPPHHYRPLVREMLAHQTLSQRTDSPRLALPPELHAWVRGLQEAWSEELRVRGYDVVGDLDDLAGGAPRPWVDPDRPDEADVASAALESLKAVLCETVRVADDSSREIERLRDVERDLHHQLDETRAALERSYLRPSYLARERIVRWLERSRVGHGLMLIYRTARGRSSRSA